MLVSFHSGPIKRMPGYEKIRDMSSFVSLQTGYTVGSKVDLTVDLFTAVGVVMFANDDSENPIKKRKRNFFDILSLSSNSASLRSPLNIT